MTKLVVTIGFIVSFLAGVMVGISAQRRSMMATDSATVPSTRPSHRGGWMAAELNLTPQQEEQMKQIWSDAARGGGRGEHEDRRRQFRRERDEAIAQLIRPEDKSRYDEVMKNYSAQTDAMDAEMRKNFEDAVRRTKELLTPEQRTKYEDMLKRRSRDYGRDGGGRDRETTRRSADAGATSRPSATQIAH